MTSFEEIPQEVIPNNFDAAQFEQAVWDQRMQGIKRTLRELRQDERNSFYTLSDLVNDRLPNMDQT